MNESFGGDVSPTFDRVTNDHVSRAEAVAHQVSELIKRQHPTPGARLGRKSDLRAQFGVAASTLNEAIRLLESRGLVETRPGPQGGIFVAEQSAQLRLSHLILALDSNSLSVSDALEIRNALEIPLAAHAAIRADREGLARLEAILARMGELQDDPAEYLRQNWHLHEEIARMSPNEMLRTIYISLIDTAREALKNVAADPHFRNSWRDNWELHRELVDAIASGSPGRARIAAERHAPYSERLTDTMS
ncbi:FadR/GntR family transcriptional regulator [Mycetocola miduiensis]|uniref:Transcriptional regulator, GntR family n=1 Tax=Mycetocola miduiensis TaxID=995034 RepID=A0A1I5ADE4_9MICO|nr:FCD domain-containing protein [Mycetocola miduiensis]SFN60437.1 transcriptional regulator, GntR family [Mycetocola miduiensis]